jgi:hypothetical protein
MLLRRVASCLSKFIKIIAVFFIVRYQKHYFKTQKACLEYALRRHTREAKSYCAIILKYLEPLHGFKIFSFANPKRERLMGTGEYIAIHPFCRYSRT